MKKTLMIVLGGIVLLAVYFLMSKNMIQTYSVHKNWIHSTGNEIEFQYPKTLGKNVWKATTRPPTITIVAKDKDPIALACPMLKNNWRPLVKTEGLTKNGVSYSLYTWSDAGAWSLYSSYCYVIEWKTNYSVLDFEMRSHTWCGNNSCGAYCETQFEKECKDFNVTKDIITPIQNIIDTIRIKK